MEPSDLFKPPQFTYDIKRDCYRYMWAPDGIELLKSLWLKLNTTNPQTCGASAA